MSFSSSSSSSSISMLAMMKERTIIAMKHRQQQLRLKKASATSAAATAAAVFIVAVVGTTAAASAAAFSLFLLPAEQQKRKQQSGDPTLLWTGKSIRPKWSPLSLSPPALSLSSLFPRPNTAHCCAADASAATAATENTEEEEEESNLIISNTKGDDDDSLSSSLYHHHHRHDYYYYERMMDPSDRTLAGSHALFGALRNQPGCIERFRVYRRVNNNNNNINNNRTQQQQQAVTAAGEGNGNIRTATTTTPSNPNNGNNTNTNTTNAEFTKSNEICVASVRVGENLNGHNKIVHGGIISLLLDETFGWGGYEVVRQRMMEGTNFDDPDFPMIVTANLDVNFRAPLPAGSDFVIRVCHDNTEGRKIYLSARLESPDGKILYSEATALFLTIDNEK